MRHTLCSYASSLKLKVAAVPSLGKDSLVYYQLQILENPFFFFCVNLKFSLSMSPSRNMKEKCDQMYSLQYPHSVSGLTFLVPYEQTGM